MENYWQKLLIKWREQGRDGFTIPFLIGSQNYLPESDNHDGIIELITDIAYGDYKVYIAYCMDIDDVILGIYDNTKEAIAGKFILQDNIETNLFVTKFMYDLGNDLESLINTLIDDYQDNIDAKEYSRNNREMGNFSDDEIDFIKSCFKEL